MRIEAGSERLPLIFSREILGPRRTIAKEKGERKEKSRKSRKNADFLVGVWKSPLKMRLERISGAPPGGRNARFS